jgi:hypothetical protein
MRCLLGSSAMTIQSCFPSIGHALPHLPLADCYIDRKTSSEMRCATEANTRLQLEDIDDFSYQTTGPRTAQYPSSYRNATSCRAHIVQRYPFVRVHPARPKRAPPHQSYTATSLHRVLGSSWLLRRLSLLLQKKPETRLGMPSRTAFARILLNRTANDSLVLSTMLVQVGLYPTFSAP